MKNLLLLVTLVTTVVGCAGVGTAQLSTVAPPPTEDDVTLQTPTGVVHGTLLAPLVSSLRPVAVIIAGSGPTDRDGNSAVLAGDNNSLKLLAEGLAARGVATLRYDKRGIGASVAAGRREEDLRFGDYVDDAAGWVEQLRGNPRFSSVSIIGHSEGALIGALAAGRTGATSYVSVAGIGRTASAVLRDQLRPQLPPALWEQSERILRELEAGRTASEVPAELIALYRPSVQPYLISWFQADPAAAFRQLQMPVMIAQGATDIQVAVGEAHALHSVAPGAQLLIVDGMNHVLKRVSLDQTGQLASYSNPDLAVAPELVEGIADFIRSADRR